MQRRTFYCLICFLTLFATSNLFAADKPIDADILLKGGTIIDGTGKAAYVGDVAILKDRIVAVGTFSVGKVEQTIDCQNFIITPGFIDLHNHSDSPIVRSATRAAMNYVTQGCTTIVTGNCGVGTVDVKKYYEKISKSGSGPNVAHLIPQGSLREDVMGSANRAPTEKEMNQMKKLMDDAMKAGAWGMSTGLIYIPSSYAKTDEIVEIASVVAKNKGIYASHIRNEGTKLLSAVEEAMMIGRQAKLPVHISHFKSSGRDAWGLAKEAAIMIEKARKNGEIVTADQYPYIASSTSLRAILVPTWARAGGSKALKKRLKDPATAERIKKSMQKNLTKRNGGEAVKVARFRPQPEWEGKSLAAIAQAEKMTPLELSVSMINRGFTQIVNFSMLEEDVRFIMQIDWVATASDGGAKLPGEGRPHPRNYGTFPRKIGHYAIAEKVLTLEKSVRSCTGLPAKILGLKDRGILKAGHFADIVVFSKKAFRDVATFEDPHQYAAGIHYVWVNGTPALFKGKATGALAGRALKHGTVKKTVLLQKNIHSP